MKTKTLNFLQHFTNHRHIHCLMSPQVKVFKHHIMKSKVLERKKERYERLPPQRLAWKSTFFCENTHDLSFPEKFLTGNYPFQYL